MVDGKSKEQQILKAAGSVDVEKLPSLADEGGEKEEGGIKSLLPPRDETAIDLKKVKVLTKGRSAIVCVQVYKEEDLLTKLELECLGDAAEKFFATRCDSEEAVTIYTDDLLNSFFSSTILLETTSS